MLILLGDVSGVWVGGFGDNGSGGLDRKPLGLGLDALGVVVFVEVCLRMSGLLEG